MRLWNGYLWGALYEQDLAMLEKQRGTLAATDDDLAASLDSEIERLLSAPSRVADLINTRQKRLLEAIPASQIEYGRA